MSSMAEIRAFYRRYEGNHAFVLCVLRKGLYHNELLSLRRFRFGRNVGGDSGHAPGSLRNAAVRPGQQKSRRTLRLSGFQDFLGTALDLLLGAQEGTRTPTVLPPLGPEPSASTNFATWANPAKAEF